MGRISFWFDGYHSEDWYFVLDGSLDPPMVWENAPRRWGVVCILQAGVQPTLDPHAEAFGVGC